MEVWQENNFGTMHDLILKDIDFDFSVLKYTSKIKQNTEGLVGVVADWRDKHYIHARRPSLLVIL